MYTFTYINIQQYQAPIYTYIVLIIASKKVLSHRQKVFAIKISETITPSNLFKLV